MTLLDQAGIKIARFGAAGVRRALTDPVTIAGDGPKDYAMVRCEEADVYITRDGKGARLCTFTVLWWDSEDEDSPQQSREYENGKRDAAIKHFLKLCKRDPMYANT